MILALSEVDGAALDVTEGQAATIVEGSASVVFEAQAEGASLADDNPSRTQAFTMDKGSEDEVGVGGSVEGGLTNRYVDDVVRHVYAY